MRCFSPYYYAYEREQRWWFEIEVTSSGDVCFRNLEVFQDNVDGDHLDRMLKITHFLHSLKLKLTFDAEILRSRVKLGADKGNAFEFELLLEATEDETERAQIIDAARKSEWEGHRRCVALVVDKDPQQIANAATNVHLDEDNRIWACDALIRIQNEKALLAALVEPPSGMETKLIAAIGTVQAAADFQKTLLRILPSEDHELLRFVVDTLGEVGDRDAVLPLQERREQIQGFFGVGQLAFNGSDLDVRSHIDIAIEHIQSRIEGENRGAVSMSKDKSQAGQVSLPDDVSGRVAMARAKQKTQNTS
jgi:hypothetical protein